MSSQSYLDSPCFVRDQHRRYRPANAEKMLEAARRVADQRMQRGTSFSDPAAARPFFRVGYVFTALAWDERTEDVIYFLADIER